SGAYGVAQVTLRHCSAPTAPGTPCPGDIVETDVATSCITSAGTMNWNANWNSRPLDGYYQAWFHMAVYSNAPCSSTPADLASWPTSKIFDLPSIGEFHCTPPPPPPPVCGNGRVEAGEQCDEGNT